MLINVETNYHYLVTSVISDIYLEPWRYFNPFLRSTGFRSTNSIADYFRSERSHARCDWTIIAVGTSHGNRKCAASARISTPTPRIRHSSPLYHPFCFYFSRTFHFYIHPRFVSFTAAIVLRISRASTISIFLDFLTFILVFSYLYTCSSYWQKNLVSWRSWFRSFYLFKINSRRSLIKISLSITKGTRTK